jgi:polar amino acid transport system substrate-binding protein
MKHSVRAAATLAAGAVLLAGCGSSSSSGTKAADDSATKDSACTAIAAKYPALKGKKITLGTSPAPANYTTTDPKNPGKFIGLEPDLLDAVASCVGFTYTFKQLDFSGLIPAAQANHIAGLAAGMYASDERAKQISFVEYMKAGEASVVAKGNPKKLTSLASMCGVTASETVGTVENAIIEKQSKACVADGKGAIKVISFQGNQLFDAVAQGRADIALTDAGVAGYLANSNPKLAVGFPISSDFIFGIGVAKTQTDLKNAVSDSLTEFSKNGQLKKLILKWGFSEDQIITPEIKG